MSPRSEKPSDGSAEWSGGASDQFEVGLCDGSRVSLRSPVPEDAEALLGYLDRVRRESDFLQFGPQDNLPTVEQEREWIKGATLAPTSRQILAEADGAPVALAGLHGSAAFAKTAHRASLGISVRADWQGRGLGRWLMNDLVEWARANPSLDLLTLSVYDGNDRARVLYASLGFVVDGVTPGAIRGAEGAAVDEVHMSLWTGAER